MRLKIKSLINGVVSETQEWGIIRFCECFQGGRVKEGVVAPLNIEILEVIR